MPHSIAVWGKGFAIESLKNIEWLAEKEIYYWSDLDVQGLQMLSQLRSYYPQTKSFLMQIEILEKYREFIVSGTPSKTESLAHLFEEEMILYTHLSGKNLRLEQERIDQDFILNSLLLL